MQKKESKEIEFSDEQEEPYKPLKDKDFFARIAIQDYEMLRRRGNI